MIFLPFQRFRTAKRIYFRRDIYIFKKKISLSADRETEFINKNEKMHRIFF